MKKLIYLVFASALLAGCDQAETKKTDAEPAKAESTSTEASSAATTDTAQEPKPMAETEIANQSYAIGVLTGQNTLARSTVGDELILDIDAVLRGYEDALREQSTMSEAELRTHLTAYQAKVQGMIDQEAEKVAQAGRDFLEANKTKEGVKVTESGLQYKEITAGDGKTFPLATDTVQVHYVGTLIDGTKFDSSRDRGEPIDFPLNRVISGWTEGLQLMSKGARYELYIPFELAYGKGGRPPSIPPSATLIFDVELLDVNPQAEKTATE